MTGEVVSSVYDLSPHPTRLAVFSSLGILRFSAVSQHTGLGSSEESSQKLDTNK